MESNLIVYAVPVFFFLIAAEYLVARNRHHSLYEIKDFANNVSTGILEESVSISLQGILFYAYHVVYQHAALLTINPKSVWAWFVLWIAVDFLYYWFHRGTHRIVFLWIGHSVHHQSEHYNLSVALRQGIWQSIWSPMIYLPLALAGFPVWMFLTVLTLNTLYQFWLHTETIGKLGWLEYVFNTPSHHRVHHGKNAEYIDKNYAGSLIIWDKLFGTFQAETVPAEYGVTEPLDTWNPFYANIKVAADMVYYGQFLKKTRSRLALFFRPPEAIITELGPERFNQVKRRYTRNNQAVPVWYVLVNTSLAVVGFCYFIAGLGGSPGHSLVSAVFLLLTLLLTGVVSNGGRRVYFGEIIRSVLIVWFLVWSLNTLMLPIVVGVLFFLINYLLVFNRSFSLSTIVGELRYLIYKSLVTNKE
ncbi:sterol desaturase family protein [Legionella spiritensis]|uniref:sterol desaturase family protein n=1 Tax=Legionella spiritensis TaxID=452 RepID=UPI000F6E3B1A|nr:sterol desaturase family protein [Legionella spiritensis]VEG90754.1 sterol desaturase-related protein [Legionella spiritensis]